MTQFVAEIVILIVEIAILIVDIDSEPSITPGAP